MLEDLQSLNNHWRKYGHAAASLIGSFSSYNGKLPEVKLKTRWSVLFVKGKNTTELKNFSNATTAHKFLAYVKWHLKQWFKAFLNIVKYI
jgi:hypothetical protein